MRVTDPIQSTQSQLDGVADLPMGDAAPSPGSHSYPSHHGLQGHRVKKGAKTAVKTQKLAPKNPPKAGGNVPGQSGKLSAMSKKEKGMPKDRKSGGKRGKASMGPQGTVKAMANKKSRGIPKDSGLAIHPNHSVILIDTSPEHAFSNVGHRSDKKLTAAARNKIKGSNFALPGRRYPINDPSHARAALSMAAKHASPAEQKRIRAAVHRKYPSIGKGGKK